MVTGASVRVTSAVAARCEGIADPDVSSGFSVMEVDMMRVGKKAKSK